MDLDRYVVGFRENGERILELADGDLDAAVPPCPGWSLADLVDHVSRVYSMVAHALETGQKPDTIPDRPDDVGVAEWFTDRFERVTDLFASVEPAAPVWNWSVLGQEASSWFRRTAQETAVHRWDAESATDSCTPIEAELAADGIDEWFDVHVRTDATMPELSEGNASGSLHVHCNDTDGEWWAVLTDRVLELEREHKKGDAVIRGGASDILLALWGRVPLSDVEVLGDPAVVASWLSVPDI